MNNESTIDVAPVAQWFDIFCSMGVDKTKLLAALECQESELRQKDNRISAIRHNAMLNLGTSELDDPGVILKIGVQSAPEHMGVVGHLMMNSETLLEAGHLTCAICQRVKWNGALVDRGLWDQFSLSACIGTLRALSLKSLIPLEVGFTHHDPGYAQEYQNVFGISVGFERDESTIRIHREDALQSIPHHQSYLLELLQQHAKELLNRLDNANQITADQAANITA